MTAFGKDMLLNKIPREWEGSEGVKMVRSGLFENYETNSIIFIAA